MIETFGAVMVYGRVLNFRSCVQPFRLEDWGSLAGTLFFLHSIFIIRK
jgi:hypothetical protein